MRSGIRQRDSTLFNSHWWKKFNHGCSMSQTVAATFQFLIFLLNCLTLSSFNWSFRVTFYLMKSQGRFSPLPIKCECRLRRLAVRSWRIHSLQGRKLNGERATYKFVTSESPQIPLTNSSLPIVISYYLSQVRSLGIRKLVSSFLFLLRPENQPLIVVLNVTASHHLLLSGNNLIFHEREIENHLYREDGMFHFESDEPLRPMH